jgi:glycosyltransferase involved in cell wall biosynthesis
MTRLCVITNTLDTGGAETQLLRLCHRLHEHGVEVTVVYYGGRGDLREAFDQTPAQILFMDRDAIGRVRFVFHLRRFLRQRRFDVVHCWRGTANQYGGAAAALAGCRCVLTGRRDLWSGTLAERAVDRLIRPFTVGHVVNSQAIRNRYAQSAHYPLDRIQVVHNGLEPERFEQIDPDAARRSIEHPPDRAMVLTVGRIVTIKRQDLFVQAAERLIERGIEARFYIAGDGPGRAGIESMIAQRRLIDHVRLLGRRSDVPELLAAADLSVMTSPEEGLPNAVLESMMVGTAVVTVDNGGGTELVNDPALTVPCNDTNALVDAMQALLRDPDRRGRVGATLKQRAMSEFSLDQAVRRYVEVLNWASELARGKGAK